MRLGGLLSRPAMSGPPRRPQIPARSASPGSESPNESASDFHSAAKAENSFSRSWPWQFVRGSTPQVYSVQTPALPAWTSFDSRDENVERDFKTLIVLALAILAKGVENLSLSHGMKTVAPPEAPTPPGFRAAAIGVSQDYDSVGELSRGAYGVIRSHDGGKTWGRPRDTGLRIQAPS